MLEKVLAQLDPKSLNMSEANFGSGPVKGARFENVCMALSKIKHLSELTLLTAAGRRDEREQLIEQLTAYMAHQYKLEGATINVMFATVEKAIDDALTPGRCKHCGGTGEIFKPGYPVEQCPVCRGNGSKLASVRSLGSAIKRTTGKSLTRTRLSQWFARYEQVFQIVCSLNSDAWAELREAISDTTEQPGA